MWRSTAVFIATQQTSFLWRKPRKLSVTDMNGFEVVVSNDFRMKYTERTVVLSWFFTAMYVMSAFYTTHTAPLLGILKNVLDNVQDHLLGQKTLPYKLTRHHKTQTH